MTYAWTWTLYEIVYGNAITKSMKSTWPTAHSGGSSCVQFQGTKKSPYKCQDLNVLVYNMLKEFIKQNKCVKAASEHYSRSEEEPENFNFENLISGVNETTPEVTSKMKQKCEEKARRQDK